MAALTRRRFLALIATGIGAAACGTTQGAVLTTAMRTTTSTPASPTPASPTTSGAVTSTVPPPTTTAATTTTGAVAPASGIDVICKEAWGAQPVIGDFVAHTIDRITIHHTAVLLEDNALAPARLRQHQRFHQSRGWPDLAYHFVIDANGNVYEGRPIEAAGDTGTDYDPTGHLLICCEGNFDEQDVPEAQYATLVAMVAWGAAEYDIDPYAVEGHRDVAATSCPGDRLYARIAAGTLGEDVAATTSGSLAPTVTCGPNAQARVAAIEAASVDA